MRKIKKTLSLILVLAMFLVLFPGVTQASVNVTIGSNQRNVAQADVFRLFRILIRSAAQDVVSRIPGDRTIVRVTLPAGLIWNQTPALAHVATTFQAVSAASTVSSFARENDNRTAVFTVESTERVDMISFSGIEIDFTNDNLRGLISAEVFVQSQFVDAQGAIHPNWEQRTSVPIAEVLAVGTTVLVGTDAPRNVLRGAADQLAGGIRIDENIARSFATSSAITFTTPPGVTFARVPTLESVHVPPITGSPPGSGHGIVLTSPNTVTVTTRNALSINPSRIEIRNVRLNVEPTVPDGQIIIDVRGTNINASIAVATVGVFGVVTVSPATDVTVQATLNAGRLNQRVSDIRFVESLVDVFPGNRKITLTLAEGFTWHSAANPAWTVAAARTISDDRRTLTYWTTADPSGAATTPATMTIGSLFINTHASARPGNIVVTVGGSTGVTEDVTVAFLRSPITATAAATPDVRFDSLGQPLGNLVITEAHQGTLMGGTSAAPTTLTITLPEGTRISGTPTVAVTDVEGTEPDVTLVTPVGGATGNVITLNVVAPSVAATNPAIITVSGIRIDLDRVPEGAAITASIAGSSLLQGSPATSGLAGTDLNTARGTSIAEVVLGNVLSRTARRTVFTVDTTTFTVDGGTQPALDVAPVIQDGRTMMPIRAAANAAGVTGDNILFDAGVITIIRGDRIAQFTLGSRVVLVNGVAMNMDAAPALVAGRALIPVRWVGTALGVPVVWDGTARTVTVTVQ